MLSVVFAVPRTDRLAVALDALVRFYAPLGHAAIQTQVVPGGTVGWIAFDAAEHERLQEEADHDQLTWEGATFAWADGELRTDPGAAIPITLYRCDDVIATHAVAAAWLARGRRPQVRFDLVPELVLHEFVLGYETLVAGVAPVTRAGAWPAPPEREEDAPALALQALLDTLRSGGLGERPALGLTGGLDSRVVAAALAHLGLPATTFTWSHHEQDAAGAAAVAARLGLPHERCPPEFLDEDAGLAQMDADVRWSEGIARLTPFGRVTFPAGISAFVTGGGGEIGRAFYYRYEAANHRRPDTARLVRLLNVRERLPYADAGTIRELERRLGHELHAMPAEGWRKLDLFYAQRRVARWGRAMLARAAAPTHAAFAHPAVAAPLIAMSERDRTTDGFHRYALRELVGEELPAAPAQRRGVPTPVRRMAARARRRQAPPARWAYADELERRPHYRRWLHDALGEAQLGPRWTEALQAGVAAGHEGPVMQALLATAPVALDRALADLPLRA